MSITLVSEIPADVRATLDALRELFIPGRELNFFGDTPKGRVTVKGLYLVRSDAGYVRRDVFELHVVHRDPSVEIFPMLLSADVLRMVSENMSVR